MTKTWLPRWRQPIEQVNKYCEIKTGFVFAEHVDVNTAQHFDANAKPCSQIHYLNEIFMFLLVKKRHTIVANSDSLHSGCRVKII